MGEETRRHLDYLDGWRGLAVLLVLVGHFWADDIEPGISVLGVDFFFVLSGRLMAEILFVQKSPLPSFFFRRFSRVYPGLFFFVIGASLLFAGTPYRNGPLAALLALTFTINYAMIFTHPVALLDHLWSLCVEEHAYILLAGIALLARRRAFPGGWIVLFIGVGAATNGIFRAEVLHQGAFEILWSSDVQAAPIFLSAACYLAFRRLDPEQISPWIAPVSLVGGVTANIWGGNAVIDYGLAMGLLAIAANTIDATFAGLRSLFEVRALRTMGMLSYSLYLWQQPFYKLSRDHGHLSLFLLLVSFVAGSLSFYLIERPSRRVLNGRWQARVAARNLVEAEPP